MAPARNSGASIVQVVTVLLALPLAVFTAVWLWPARPSEPVHVPQLESAPPPSEQRVPSEPAVIVSTAPEACHEEPLTATQIRVDFVDGAAPTLNGGDLTSGVYDAISYEVFGDIPEQTLARTFRQTLVIDTEASLIKTVRQDQHGRVQTWTWAADTKGSTLSMTGRCPAGLVGGRESVQYGVQGADLLTSFEQVGVPVVVTYRRRVG